MEDVDVSFQHGLVHGEAGPGGEEVDLVDGDRRWGNESRLRRGLLPRRLAAPNSSPATRATDLRMAQSPSTRLAPPVNEQEKGREVTPLSPFLPSGAGLRRAHLFGQFGPVPSPGPRPAPVPGTGPVARARTSARAPATAATLTAPAPPLPGAGAGEELAVLVVRAPLAGGGDDLRDLARPGGTAPCRWRREPSGGTRRPEGDCASPSRGSASPRRCRGCRRRRAPCRRRRGRGPRWWRRPSAPRRATPSRERRGRCRARRAGRP